MLHNPALEAAYVSTYVEDYLDGLENLPNRIQPHISEIKRLDVEHTAIMSTLRELRAAYAASDSGRHKSALYARIVEALVQGQLIGNDKLNHLAAIHELIEAKTDQLEHDANSFGVSAENQPDQQQHSQSRPSRTTNTPNHHHHAQRRAQSPAAQMASPTSAATPQPQPPPSRQSSVQSVQSTWSKRDSHTPVGHHHHGNSAASKRARRQKEFPDFVREQNEKQSASAAAKSPAHSTSTGSTGDHDEVNEVVSRCSSRSHTNAAAAAAAAAAAQTTPKQSHHKKTTVGAGGGGSRSEPHPQSSSFSSTRGRKKRMAATAASHNLSHQQQPTTTGRKRTNSHSSSSQQPQAPAADPGEPVYCVCNQASYGDMVGCDYDNCEIEWFHFSCVGLTGKPKGKWYCPECRGDKATLLKSSLR